MLNIFETIEKKIIIFYLDSMDLNAHKENFQTIITVFAKYFLVVVEKCFPCFWKMFLTANICVWPGRVDAPSQPFIWEQNYNVMNWRVRMCDKGGFCARVTPEIISTQFGLPACCCLVAMLIHHRAFYSRSSHYPKRSRKEMSEEQILVAPPPIRGRGLFSSFKSTKLRLDLDKDKSGNIWKTQKKMEAQWKLNKQHILCKLGR